MRQIKLSSGQGRDLFQRCGGDWRQGTPDMIEGVKVGGSLKLRQATYSPNFYPEAIVMDGRAGVDPGRLYATLGQWTQRPRSEVARGKRGVFGSKLELRFGQWLEAQGLWWVYEPVRLRYGDRATYTPDFVVLHGNEWRWYEVKGFRREDDRVKLKACQTIWGGVLDLWWAEWVEGEWRLERV